MAATVIAVQHHEHWNGSGYPNKLSGDEIHIYARITAIADVFDALTTDRIYRKAWTIEKTREFMLEERGKQFDPSLVDIFLGDFDSFLAIHKRLT
jgi:HD-GYP domain-containing protein (c-di-GMP phosphodiesterase class II)